MAGIKNKGAIVGLAMIVSTATAGVWASSPPAASSSEAKSCGMVFAGRAGSFNSCNRPKDDLVTKNIKKGVGSTLTGCGMGLATGGIAGFWPGCAGGAVSSIPWGGWD